MKIDYNKKAIIENLIRLTNQIYKLIPLREEKLNWKKYLESIILELTGMNEILYDYQNKIFPIICKLKGLLKNSSSFLMYRKTIFECLNLINSLEKELCNQD